jgi:acyl dehydratase
METVGIGFYFEDLPVGRQFKTVGRTVTEADIVNFVNCTGMVEVLFTNVEFLKEESEIRGRVAPQRSCTPLLKGCSVRRRCNTLASRSSTCNST